MSRKKRKIHYQLEPIDDGVLSDIEIYKILRAANEIIYSAGRAMLSKILKGSKDKKLLELKLDMCPSYGCFNELTIIEITKRVDWMIVNDYLEIQYNGRLPMIVFTQKGWNISKVIYTEELYEGILERMHTETEELIKLLNNTNREVVHLLLYKIADSKNIGFIRFLEKWKEAEVKKVRARIDEVIKALK